MLALSMPRPAGASSNGGSCIVGLGGAAPADLTAFDALNCLSDVIHLLPKPDREFTAGELLLLSNASTLKQ